MPQRKKVEFYLSHSKMLELVNALAGPLPNKGLLVTVEVVHEPQTASFDIASTIAAAMGQPDPQGGIPVITSSVRAMCPHPPACT